MHESEFMHLHEVISNNSFSQINLVSFCGSLRFETGVCPTSFGIYNKISLDPSQIFLELWELRLLCKHLKHLEYFSLCMNQ